MEDFAPKGVLPFGMRERGCYFFMMAAIQNTALYYFAQHIGTMENEKRDITLEGGGN